MLGEAIVVLCSVKNGIYVPTIPGSDIGFKGLDEKVAGFSSYSLAKIRHIFLNYAILIYENIIQFV